MDDVRGTVIGENNQVYAPDRVFRAWAMLTAAGDELHHVALPALAVDHLHRQLRAIADELARDISADLATELFRLIHPDQPAPTTAEELRVEYASLLGWVAGLVMNMIGELDASGREYAPGPENGAPETGREGSLP